MKTDSNEIAGGIVKGFLLIILAIIFIPIGLMFAVLIIAVVIMILGNLLIPILIICVGIYLYSLGVKK